MSDLGVIEIEFKELVFKFLMPIQTERFVDHHVFQEVDLCAKKLARSLKDHQLVPKSMLKELHMASKVLHAEAPFIKSETETMTKMAEQLEFTFDLILLGETPEDRVPGVPRVV